MEEIYDKLIRLKFTPNVITYDNLNDPTEIFHTKEGRLTLREHKSKERSKKLVQKFKNSLESYNCIICGFNFEKVYGELGKEFIEAHHIIPVKDMKENTKISTKDLIPVCSNCHRMLHRKNPPVSFKELKKLF